MAKRINPFRPMLDKIPVPLRNKYILTLILFVIVIVFFNDLNPFAQWGLQDTKVELEEKRKYYEEKLQEVRLDIRDSERDKEKFAREHYYMKKKDEDVFIIVEEENKNQ